MPFRQPLLSAATCAVLALVLIQALTPIAPDIYWDMDPRGNDLGMAATMLGPAAMAWINVLSVLVAGLALGVHVWADGRLRYTSLLLAGVGMIPAVVHLFGPAENLMRCGNWLAGISLALAALHLAEHERCRRLMIASLVALIVPLALGAMLYVFVDHRQTLEQFRQTQDQFLEARGWQPGSPQHLMYVRRMEQSDAIGPFGLSNVFGSIVAALAMMAAALAVGRRRRIGAKAAILPAALAGLALLTVALTRSKGAMFTLAPVVVLLVMSLMSRRKQTGERVTRFPFAPVAMALVILAFVAVLVRGGLGPPDSHEGERSLLFRFHYWQAAANIIVDQPARIVLGVGPEGFHELYPQVKNPINPEEVTSTHNVFLDFFTMLGLGGLAWSALLMYWLWCAGKRLCVPRPVYPDEADLRSTAGPPELRPSDLALAVGVAAPVFAVPYIVTIVPAPLLSHVLVWLIGAAAFVAIVTVMLSPAWQIRYWMDVSAFLAAALLMAHSQIEMTFFHWGACVVAMAIVAVAASDRQPEPPPPPVLPPDHPDAIDPPIKKVKWQKVLRAPAFFTSLAVVMLIVYVVPVALQQQALRRAAVSLRAGDPPTALEHLDRAIDALGRDHQPYHHKARLLAEWAERQARAGKAQEARQLFTLALAAADDARDVNVGRAGLARLQAHIELRAAAVLDEAYRHAAAVRHLRDAIERSPGNIHDHLRLADVLWRLGDHEEAGRVYQRVIRLHQQMYLDPLRQLTIEELKSVSARIKAVQEGI